MGDVVTHPQHFEICATARCKHGGPAQRWISIASRNSDILQAPHLRVPLAPKRRGTPTSATLKPAARPWEIERALVTHVVLIGVTHVETRIDDKTTRLDGGERVGIGREAARRESSDVVAGLLGEHASPRRKRTVCSSRE